MPKNFRECDVNRCRVCEEIISQDEFVQNDGKCDRCDANEYFKEIK